MKLAWNNPNAHTNDPNPHTQNDNAGYKVSLNGAAPIDLPGGIKYGTSADISALVDGLPAGTHTLTMAAVTTKGAVGKFSAPASFTVLPQPAAPTNVTIT